MQPAASFARRQAAVHIIPRQTCCLACMLASWDIGSSCRPPVAKQWYLLQVTYGPRVRAVLGSQPLQSRS